MSTSGGGKRVTRKRDVRGKIEEKTAGRTLHAFVFDSRTGMKKIMKAEGSTALSSDDPFQVVYGKGLVIEPPLPLEKLAELPGISSILPQCIQAMVTNVTGFGYELDYVGPPSEVRDDGSIVEGTGPESKAAVAEKKMIDGFLSTANPWESWESLCDKRTHDYEGIGNAYFEIVRNRGGKLSYLNHVVGKDVRLIRQDKETTTVTVKLIRDGKEVSVDVPKRFRRYVQIVGSSQVYFKEYGDPRIVDKRNGAVSATTLSEQFRANEVYHFAQYFPGSSYGMPRFVGALISIYGAKKAEDLNYYYFTNGSIPPAIIMISGGSLTGDSFDTIKDYWSEETTGPDKLHKLLLIEAIPSDTDLGKEGTVKIDVKPLTDMRLTDALFQDYDKNSRKKIRSIFRLASLFVGETEDITKAVADASRGVTEEQVFVPERRRFDFWMNRVLLPELGAKLYAYRSKSPEFGDGELFVSALRAFNAAGAMTPNHAVKLLKEVLGLELPKITEPWGNYPFPLIVELVKQGIFPGMEGLLKLAEKTGGMLGGDKGAPAGADAAAGADGGVVPTGDGAAAGKVDQTAGAA